MTNESDKMAMNEAVEGTKAEFRIRPLPENKYVLILNAVYPKTIIFLQNNLFDMVI